MKFTVITLFPNVINEYINTSIIARAVQNNLVQIDVVDLREFGKTKRKNVDDTVYGGGAGQVITAEVLDHALQSVEDINASSTKVLYMGPRGKVLNQKMVRNYSKCDSHYVVICGHYEGIDERIFSLYNIQEISIGDYIVTGGELPALVFLDSVIRTVKGVIKEESNINESFENILLEEAMYTKPVEYKGLKVPSILLSGDHQKIDNYRYEERLYTTLKNRPDLFKRYINENKLDEKSIEKINKIITKKEGN